jgi:hypothetical protein
MARENRGSVFGDSRQRAGCGRCVLATMHAAIDGRPHRKNEGHLDDGIQVCSGAVPVAHWSPHLPHDAVLRFLDDTYLADYSSPLEDIWREMH